MVVCLERGADLHTAQLMSLPLTVSASVKSRLVLPFWYWLTRVVPEKGPLNGCVCVCGTTKPVLFSYHIRTIQRAVLVVVGRCIVAGWSD